MFCWHVLTKLTCDSRSTVLYSNSSLGVSQPTHLYYVWFFNFVMWRHTRKSLKTQARRKVRASVSMQVWTIWIYNIYVIYRYHIIIVSYRFLQFFADVLAEHVNSAGPQSEKSSCIFRASFAQAPRKQKMHPLGSEEREPMSTLWFPPNSRQRKKARKTQEQQCNFAFGFAWLEKNTVKVRASVLLQGNWSLSVFASRFDDCQTRYVF